MSLLNTPNVSQNPYLEDLLFPVPLIFDHEDCYVAEPTSERWRSFIDVEDWEPEIHNKSILNRRKYHARVVWETTMLIAMTDINWLSTSAIQLIQDVAKFELRVVEIELVSYQLTCGMIGIGAKERVKLYHCAVNLFMCNMFIAEVLMGDMDEKQKKIHRKLMGIKPMPGDSKKDLCRQIDLGVFGAHEMLNKGSNKLPMAQLSNKLKSVIISLDAVLIIQ